MILLCDKVGTRPYRLRFTTVRPLFLPTQTSRQPGTELRFLLRAEPST